MRDSPHLRCRNVEDPEFGCRFVSLAEQYLCGISGPADTYHIPLEVIHLQLGPGVLLSIPDQGTHDSASIAHSKESLVAWSGGEFCRLNPTGFVSNLVELFSTIGMERWQGEVLSPESIGRHDNSDLSIVRKYRAVRHLPAPVDHSRWPWYLGDDVNDMGVEALGTGD